MKIVINYDLFEKVRTSNGVLNLQRIMIKEVKVQTVFYGIFSATDLLLFDKIRWEHNFAYCAIWFITRVTLFAVFEQLLKSEHKSEAYKELVKLSGQLKDLNINTSPELIKESELIKSDYKLINDKFKPIIQQNKYISMPVYDGLGDEKDISILQEHEMGSKEYVLSIGSPKKSFKLAHAYNQM